jgi:pilus assembly protein TadC
VIGGTAIGLVVACGPWLVRRPRCRPTRVRRADAAAALELDTALALDLLDVAVSAGASLPDALRVVGSAVGGAQGAALRSAGSALLLGASWDSAWASAPDGLRDVAVALGPSWTAGAAPGPALRARAEQHRRGRRAHVRSAAGSLGVRLVLPLGLCFLPAFVLLGLVPMLLGLASGLLA